MKFFGVKEFFIRNFDFKNGCKNDCENKNEKSAAYAQIGFTKK